MMKERKGKLINYIFAHKYYYILGLLTLLIVDYCNLFIPQITGEITDGLATFSFTIHDVVSSLLYLLFFVLVITVGRVLWRFFLFGVSRIIEREIRNDLFEKLETLSQNYFHHHKTGDLMAVFTNDLEALRYALGPAVISAFDAIVMTMLVLYQMIVYVDLRLTLLTCIPMSMIGIGSYFFIDLFEKRYFHKQEAFAKLSDFVQESITGERVIKAFVEEENQDKHFEQVNQHNKKMNMKVVQLMATVMPLLDFVIGLSYVLTIVYGGYLTLTGQITLGRFVAFNQYIGMLVWPMIAFGDSITYLSQGKAAMRRISEIFDEVAEIQDENVLDIESLKGVIEINNLSFRYGDNLPEALLNINIRINEGETLAILGKTGSGKTTFVNLLMRLYNVDRNMIRIDGHDIFDISLKTLRSNISYVPQDNYLFSDTIENNVAFGNPNATKEEIIQACKDACVHDNIITFPKQYETMVGERGVTLSGGQKQRCSIARALIKEAPILILDDSLSAVDTDTEEEILSNLKQRTMRQTTIIIAHRVSTLKNADHIMVLDEGKIVEYGNFDELMNQDGYFKHLYDKQQLQQQLVME